MFTKWSNFAKPRQTRAKARDYELGKTFRHTVVAGFSPRSGSGHSPRYEARSLVFGPKKLPELGKGSGEGIRGFKKAMTERDDEK